MNVRVQRKLWILWWLVENQTQSFFAKEYNVLKENLQAATSIVTNTNTVLQINLRESTNIKNNSQKS